MAEPWRCVVIVPWDVGRTGANQRLHWRERANRNRAAKEIARLAWLRAGAPQAPGPVAVAITVRRARALDPDNALGGAKACIDALFKAGITRDDSRRWVAFRPVEQEVGRQWRGREEVVFEVEAV